jgi:putative hydrolase of the HAD superfamily
MIKNIVFDLGNVLMKYDPKAYLQSLGYSMEEVTELMKLIFNGVEWKLADQGLLSNQQLTDIYLLKAPQYSFDIRYIMQNWKDIITMMDESKRFFQDVLDKGYQVYLLSNYPEYGFKEMWDNNPILSNAHGSVISYQVKMTKPSKEIFLYLLEKYDLNPEETVFFDDLLENINGARKAGIHGIRFKSVSQAKKDLLILGVQV